MLCSRVPKSWVTTRRCRKHSSALDTVLLLEAVAYIERSYPCSNQQHEHVLLTNALPPVYFVGILHADWV
jgi:hypothetical protein